MVKNRDRALQARGEALDARLHTQVAAAYDALEADPIRIGR